MTAALTLLTIAVMLFACLGYREPAAHAQEQEEQEVYEDDFNAYSVRADMPTSPTLPFRWQFSQPANTAITLEAHPAQPADRYLRIVDTGAGTGFAQLYFESLSSGTATVEFDIRTEADSDLTRKHDFFGATLYSSQNEAITQLQNSTQANGYAFKLLQKNDAGQAISSSMLPAASYADGSWYRIRLIVDLTQKKVKAECYDQAGTTLLGTVDYAGFQIPEATDVAAIKFVTTTSGWGILSVDNVKVTSHPEETGGPVTQNIVVDVSDVLSNVYANPVGVVSNHLFDSDIHHPARANSFAQSLQELGSGTVRFGEGEASDRYLWTGPPYPADSGSPLVPQLSYYYSTQRILSNSERALLNPDGTYKQTQDFKEFMNAVHPLGIQPFVIVGLDAIKATDADWAKSKEELKTAAVEWVRYANVTNDWNVKYWEIGNEPFFTSQSGHIWSPHEYAAVFLEFAAAMKAVDPSILVGVPVHDSVSWNSAVLPVVSGTADFLALHMYGTTNIAPLDTLVQHIRQYCAPEDRERLRIAITETNTYSSGSPFPNDMGRAALLATKIGKILQYDQVDYMHFWVTRKGLNNDPQDERSAIDEDGQLLAMGKALQLWNAYVKENMVSVTGATQISPFASHSPSSGELSLVLINSGNSAVPVHMTLQHYSDPVVNERWVLSGTGATDPDPVFGQFDPIGYADGTADFELAANSITVVAFKPAP
jgi:hypothetical protein